MCQGRIDHDLVATVGHAGEGGCRDFTLLPSGFNLHGGVAENRWWVLAVGRTHIARRQRAGPQKGPLTCYVTVSD
jgi:hypothetical protein